MSNKCPTCGRSKPKPRKPIPKVNKQRRAKRMEETFSDQARMCRLVPCCLPRCARQAEPAHVRSRGAGGKDDQCVPLCRNHHREQHDVGIKTFEAKYGVSLEVIAASMAEAVRDHACSSWAVRDKDGNETCAVCGSMTGGLI